MEQFLLSFAAAYPFNYLLYAFTFVVTTFDNADCNGTSSYLSIENLIPY